MNRATEAKLDALVNAMAEAFGPKELKGRLQELVNWMPEDEHAPLLHSGITKAEMKKVPFFSETYLYGLLGKEDARTLLARMRRVCEAAGFDMESLYRE